MISEGHPQGLQNTIIRVRVQPRVKRNEIVEIREDGQVKIRLTAPPVDGAANHELIRFLGKILGTAPSNLKIVSGFSSRDKLVSISNLESKIIGERLKLFIEKK